MKQRKVNSDCFKRGPKPKLNPEDELFITLAWLKNVFSLYHLSWLFKIPVSMSRHLISLMNFLYLKLGNIPIWPSKEEILETMPTSFKKTYPNTRCIIDCTKLFVNHLPQWIPKVVYIQVTKVMLPSKVLWE